MTTTKQGPTSISSLLLDGMQLFDAEVAKIGDDDWSRPTPCSDWTVTELVRHTADTADRVTAFLRGETWEASTSQARPADRWHEARTELRTQMHGATVDDRWPIPEDSPYAKLRFHGCDFAVHTCDLATALGRDDELPEGWVAYLDEFFHSVTPEVLRRPRAFHDPQNPVEGDGPTRRLMAFLGRQPLA